MLLEGIRSFNTEFSPITADALSLNTQSIAFPASATGFSQTQTQGDSPCKAALQGLLRSL